MIGKSYRKSLDCGCPWPNADCADADAGGFEKPQLRTGTWMVARLQDFQWFLFNSL